MSAGELERATGTPAEKPALADGPAHLVEAVARPRVAAPASAVLPAGPPAHAGSLPTAPSAAASMTGRVQVYLNRALAEAFYQARRAGTAMLAGIAAVVLAATVFIANNLPQGGVVAALKSQLVHLAPTGGGAAAVGPSPVAALSALPSRSEAPEIVAKIVEEARASGVELPRGQYEYVAARDGVAASYRMTFPVHATYPQLREFMDRTLVALPAVAVEGMRIERKTVGDAGVDAELKFSAFVRSEP